MRTGTEQLVKGVNKCILEKKILLVERLIGTEKRRGIYIKRVHDFWEKVNQKKFWRTWHLSGNT